MFVLIADSWIRDYPGMEGRDGAGFDCALKLNVGLRAKRDHKLQWDRSRPADRPHLDG